ncbi:MAG: transaldolase family protein [Candidatus Omnitrophota bacterium]|jgi:transaldolase
MAIFIDTGKIKEIERFHKMGLIRGVTTNPTILVKDGLKGGMSQVKRHSIEIAELIKPYPLSVEVTTNDRDDMLSQAREFSGWAENIVVKITAHGPEGELDNMEVVHELETKHNIRVNVTAMMSAQQCFLASLAGASYVSIFGGRVNNMGYNAVEEIKKLRKLLDDFRLKSQIIVGSTREVLNIIEWLYAGAHIVTALPKLIEGMLIHPYTKETVRMFLDDSLKLKEQMSHERIEQEAL